MADHYDVIIVGSGAGGGTLAYRLATQGKRVLLLERGGFLPREKENWLSKIVFGTHRYFGSEVWYDPNGKELHPGMGYFVGGNTKLYGAALFRLRERDFAAYAHRDGLSPAWPLPYSVFEPYYTQAEQLYHVHGQQGLDPTEPPRSGEYPYPAIHHEPRIQEISDALTERGLHPYYTPVGVRLNAAQMYLSDCIRCDTCDGYPCLVGAKADAEVTAVRPIMGQAHVTLLTHAKVLKLHSSSSGREITGVEAEVQGEKRMFSGDVVALSCGAVNSAVVLLKSANDSHPNGLANGSDLVGRNLMKHVLGSILAVSRELNPTVFQKTISINDFYWGEPGYDYPMGQIQTTGKVNADALSLNPAPYAPLTPTQVAEHSTDWWLTTEDIPDPNNRIMVNGDKILMQYQENNTESFQRLEHRWVEILQAIGAAENLFPHPSYFDRTCRRQECDAPASPPSYFASKMGVDNVAHQVGTCLFGTDPQTSVLDVHCRTHEVDNLYVVDGSFFPSSGAVNPTLTIIANALRVGDHLLARLG